jgi:hypothetical protein
VIQILVIQTREMVEMMMTIAAIVEIHLVHRMIVEIVVTLEIRVTVVTAAIVEMEMEMVVTTVAEMLMAAETQKNNSIILLTYH